MTILGIGLVQEGSERGAYSNLLASHPRKCDYAW
jgi:hypothetical protein